MEEPPTQTKSSGSIPLDRDQPVIMLFDSLANRHMGVFQHLRKYVVQEAKDRLGIDINTRDINAVHAKVPIQTNLSDCGLYVLHYVEKFIYCPDYYAGLILSRENQRKETDDLWKTSQVPKLRGQIRDTIETHRALQEIQVKAQNDLKVRDSPSVTATEAESTTSSPEVIMHEAKRRRSSNEP